MSPIRLEGRGWSSGSEDMNMDVDADSGSDSYSEDGILPIYSLPLD